MMVEDITIENDIVVEVLTRYFLTQIEGAAEEILRVPATLLTPEFYIRASKINGMVLHYIPMESRTEEIICNCLSNDGYSLGAVPMSERSELYCSIALNSSKYAKKFIPAME